MRVLLALAAFALITPVAPADDPAAPDSPLVKLLKSGRVPEARLGAIVDMIGKRGTAGDLDFIFQQAICIRRLPGTAQSQGPGSPGRGGRKPQPCARPKDVDKLAALIGAGPPRSDPALEKAAVRLAGLWKLEAAAEPLKALAVSPSTDDALRGEALDALAAIGGRAGRSQIEASAGPALPPGTRILAVASLAKLDVDAAAAAGRGNPGSAGVPGPRPHAAIGRLS